MVLIGWLGAVCLGQHVHEQSPINYSKAPTDNVVSRLQAQIDSGEVTLKHDQERGYLPAVLAALDVPQSSQALVFSKTSLQVTKISPRRPRAIYFNEEVYVAWVQKSNLMELSAVDPKLGAVFYTLKHTPTEKPRFERDDSTCLACHATRHTDYVPGHVVFSVYSDSLGSPIASAGFSSTDHSSSFRSRWGGWYVTGEHGEQRHRGNSTMRAFDRPENFDLDQGANRTDLSELFDVSPYLTGHSDLVSLMVMEHQAMVHNRLTEASYRGQIVAAERASPDSSKKENAADTAASRELDRAIDRLIDALLLVREAELTEPIRGTSPFATEFAALGPQDKSGRSLRELDLKSRLFRYPCSYLIYSQAFDGLPDFVRHRVYRQLREVLTSTKPSRRFSHLTVEDRQAIVEILRSTKPELVRVWDGE